jgi:hypothetical protein
MVIRGALIEDPASSAKSEYTMFEACGRSAAPQDARVGQAAIGNSSRTAAPRRRSSGGGNGRPRVEAVLFAAAKPVTRDILARVVGRDCALDQPCDHFLHGF